MLPYIFFAWCFASIASTASVPISTSPVVSTVTATVTSNVVSTIGTTISLSTTTPSNCSESQCVPQTQTLTVPILSTAVVTSIVTSVSTISYLTIHSGVADSTPSTVIASPTTSSVSSISVSTISSQIVNVVITFQTVVVSTATTAVSSNFIPSILTQVITVTRQSSLDNTSMSTSSAHVRPQVSSGVPVSDGSTSSTAEIPRTTATAMQAFAPVVKSLEAEPGVAFFLMKRRRQQQRRHRSASAISTPAPLTSSMDQQHPSLGDDANVFFTGFFSQGVGRSDSASFVAHKLGSEQTFQSTPGATERKSRRRPAVNF